MTILEINDKTKIIRNTDLRICNVRTYKIEEHSPKSKASQYAATYKT